jgi:hypothetical protein
LRGFSFGFSFLPRSARMRRLCHGLHEAAKYMLYHNEKAAVAAS